MSKRFGRNQKRRMRAEIAALELCNSVAEERIMRLIKSNTKLNDALNRVRIGVHKAFNKHHPLAETIQESNDEIGIKVRMLSSISYHPDAIAQVTCDVLELRGWPEPFKQAICYEVKYGGKSIARMDHGVKHVISELKYMSKEAIIESHSQYIARSLMEYLESSLR